MFTGGVPQDPSTTDVSFGELGLSEPVVRSLTAVGFEHPTPIQHQVIPKALEGLDIVGLAQTGSGKTGAFGLPMAERLIHGKGCPGSHSVPHPRDCAADPILSSRWSARIMSCKRSALIGGVKLGPQITDLRRHPDIVVATPGRLWDHVERRNLGWTRFEMLVMDEADHMLDLGFLPQIMRILEAVPDDRQTMMFSATMPPTIENLARRFMRSPTIIDLLPEHRTATGIDHRLYMVEPDDTRACLLALAAEEKGSMLIFLRRKIDVDWACRQLQVEGHPVEKIHSSRTQSQRVAALQGLRQREHRILIATDIAARGIDIPIIEHIVNYGMPETVEDYIHRAGRTARGAMGGTVSTIATWKDGETIRSVEKAIGESLPRCVAEGVAPYAERKTTIRGRKKIRRTTFVAIVESPDEQADCTCRRCRWHQHQDRGSDTGRPAEPQYLALCGLRHHCGRAESYLDASSTRTAPKRAAIAVACPAESDWIDITNQRWSFSIEQLRQDLELEDLQVVNDFTALAASIPRLEPQDTQIIKSGEALAERRHRRPRTRHRTRCLRSDRVGGSLDPSQRRRRPFNPGGHQ